MYRRWVSGYQFQWTPVLTYTRRHLQLLDWFEANVEPVAFVEVHTRVGVAIIADDLRVTVTRSGMYVESGLSGLSTDLLMPAVEGIFEIMEPRDTVLSYSAETGTHILPGADYHEECARFGSAMGGAGALQAGFRPVDGSVLVDLQTAETTMQVEWGIVNSEELLYRLQHPRLSRIGRVEDEVSPDQAGRHSVPPEELPPVSVFTDVFTRRRVGGEVSGIADVKALIGEANADAETVSNSFARHFEQRKEA